MEYKIAIGSYSPAEKQGIQIIQFNSESKDASLLCGVDGVENPSFIAIDGLSQRMFAVSEKASNGEVAAFSYDYLSGELTETGRQQTKGDSPCHLSVDSSGQWLLGVNYMSGSIFVFPIGRDGTLKSMSDFIQLEGKGPHRTRQEGPHPHSINNIPNTNLWVVPDLGTDRIFLYELDPDNGRLQLQYTQAVSTGAGPRHVAFHPTQPYVYVVQELNSTIASFYYNVGEKRLESLQNDIETLPQPVVSDNWSADIHISPSGEFLYASNRGHDSLAMFRIQEGGGLKLLGNYPTGKTPRSFTLLPEENVILVANQHSNNITSMTLSTGQTHVQDGVIHTMQQPVCVKLLLPPRTISMK